MQSGAETQEWATSLARQASFARGYSQLSSAILECLQASFDAGEVVEGAQSRLGRRFMAFVSARGWDNDLEPVLKLAATLHSHVLRGDPRVAGLAPYYATVTPEPTSPDDPAFAGEFLTALDLLGGEMLVEAGRWVIQTNETARGVLWLLPAALLQIEAAYLVELGASAGLNLLADLRRYDLRWDDGSALRIGHGDTPQFEVACEGPPAAPRDRRLPARRSRSIRSRRSSCSIPT